MAEYTKNLKLKKPDRKEYYNVNDFNNNMDILDEYLENFDSDGLATEDFVKDEINKIEKTEVNLDGYATEDFVKDEISKIEVTGNTEVNLDGYATEDFVNDKVENLATEDYINQKIEELNINSESTDIISKKYSTVVIGSATVGYTEKDVDFLCSGIDDQIVINQAIQSMINGGELKILEGDYNITNSILVDKDNIDIVMTSGTNLISTIEDTGTSISDKANIVYITSQNVKIKGGSITGNNNNIAIGLCSAKIFKISSIIIKNISVGINATENTNIDKIEDISIETVYTSQSFGIKTDNSTINHMNDIKIEGLTGIHLYFNSNVDIIKNVIVNVGDPYEAISVYDNSNIGILENCKVTNVEGYALLVTSDCKIGVIRDCEFTHSFVSFAIRLSGEFDLIENNTLNMQCNNDSLDYFGLYLNGVAAVGKTINGLTINHSGESKDFNAILLTTGASIENICNVTVNMAENSIVTSVLYGVYAYTQYNCIPTIKKISGFKMDNTNSNCANAFGMFISSANDISIIENCNINIKSTTAEVGGFYISRTNVNNINNCEISITRETTISNGDSGIYLTSVNNSIVTNNKIICIGNDDDDRLKSIDISSCSNMIIANNSINKDYYMGSTTNVEIRDNIITG